MSQPPRLPICLKPLRRRPWRLGTACMGLLATLACSSSHFDSWQSHGAREAQLAQGAHGGRGAYEEVLRQWTRSAKIYRALDNKMFISATYHAPAFRRAFAVAFPDIYGHGGKITRRELVDLTGGVEQHHNFLLAVHTPDVRWNDLARDDSIWRLSLYSTSHGQNGAGETEVAPDDIVPIKMDENLRAVYPFINRFDRVYLVRFPLLDPLHQMIVDADTDEMVLRIASAMGVASMRWKVAGVPERLPAEPSLQSFPAGHSGAVHDRPVLGPRGP